MKLILLHKVITALSRKHRYNVIKSNEIGSSAVNVNVLCHCNLVQFRIELFSFAAARCRRSSAQEFAKILS